MNKPKAVVGAIDIGGTKIAVGLEDDDGRVIGRAELPTNAEGEFSCAMERVADLLSKSVRETRSELLGIGIGCTGPVDPVTGALGSVNFFPHWEGRNPVAALSKVFGVRTFVENDADAAALGEMSLGVGKGKKQLICVTVGTGIGVGVVLDGRVYRGFEGIHPEAGHHVVDPSGPVCTCGARGCWESFASGPAISEWLKQRAPGGAFSPDISTEEVCANAREGDEWCLRAVDRGAFYLGVGIANLINIFAPEVVVLSGGVMKSGDLFLNKIRTIIREQCRLVRFEPTAVSLSSLGPDFGIIGAAETWRYRCQKPQGDA